jgi:hypothetical protein
MQSIKVVSAFGSTGLARPYEEFRCAPRAVLLPSGLCRPSCLMRLREDSSFV